MTHTTYTTHEPYEPTAELGGGLRALEASAGTGKTYAITSNVLRAVVEQDLRMDRLLLVTFTRAATAELEDRVRARLVHGERALRRAAADHDWEPTDDQVLRHLVRHAREDARNSDSDSDIDEARRRVEEALRTVDQATVTTIHGFCHQVLQQAAVTADTDPAVALDTDDDRLVAAVVDDWLVAFTHDQDEALVELLADVGCTRAKLQQLARTVANEPDPVLAPDAPERIDPLAVIAGAHADLRRALTLADESLAAAQAAKVAGEITGSSTWSPTPAKMPRRIDDLRAELEDGGSPSAKALSFLDPEGTKGDGSSPMPPSIAATPIPRAVDGIREAHYEVETWIRRTVADHVRAELVRRRTQAGTASFADLLRHLKDALDDDHGDQLAAAVAAEFDAVFVDEFQDTDPVQWSILHRLFARVKVFHVVGDPKQAIYGWRGADLQTYLAALRDAQAVTTMTTNWRSDAAYVDAVNHLLGGTPELRDASLGGRGVHYVAVQPAHDRPRLLAPDASDASDASDAADASDASGLRVRYLPGLDGVNKSVAIDAIAEDVAQDIVDTIDGGYQRPDDDAARRTPTTDGSTTAGSAPRRRLVAADCAVLVRRHKEAAAVADALRRRGVPVVVGGGDNVLTSDDADAMADLLRVLVAPGDDRALRRLLVGPFVGLDASELEGLSDAAWQDHAVRAREWARTWADGGIAAAVQRAIREGRAEARHARVAGGDRTMTNLRHLTELLHLAEQEEALGTHALAAWFDARRAEATDPTNQTPPERELRLERDDAAVRVMTVHAAKGLEFPLVWVPFLWTREGLGKDLGEPFVVNDPRHDHRPRTVALHAGSSESMRARSQERQQLRQEYELAEWEGGLRLAYVALTRAEHRCTVHLCAYDDRGSLPASPGWQLFLARELGDGRPGAASPEYDQDRLRATLRDLADHPTIHLDEVREELPLRMLGADEPQARPDLNALEWGRTEPLDVRWGRASFTGLLRGRAAAAPAEADASDEADTDQTADRHAHGLPELPRAVCEAAPQVPLAPLPRGAAWGTFLHDVLEHADFAATADDLGEVVAARARSASVRPTDEDLAVTTGGLHAALQTPMGPALDDLRLRDVGRGDRLDELDFTLTLGPATGGSGGAAASFNVGAIANLFDRHAADSDAPLAEAAEHLRAGGTGRPVHGLMIGSIDLVLRHPEDRRFWIADYKSNGLGQWLPPAGDEEQGRWCETEAHTTPERVMIAMRKGDYLLQAHLYIVALHRYLRARLGEAYDYERHIGGWAYLFLRGMTGEDVRRTDGLPHGIATGRPTLGLIEDLDALLRGAGDVRG